MLSENQPFLYVIKLKSEEKITIISKKKKKAYRPKLPSFICCLPSAEIYDGDHLTLFIQWRCVILVGGKTKIAFIIILHFYAIQYIVIYCDDLPVFLQDITCIIRSRTRRDGRSCLQTGRRFWSSETSRSTRRIMSEWTSTTVMTSKLNFPERPSSKRFL